MPFPVRYSRSGWFCGAARWKASSVWQAAFAEIAGFFDRHLGK